MPTFCDSLARRTPNPPLFRSQELVAYEIGGQGSDPRRDRLQAHLSPLDGALDHVLRYACFDGPGRVQVLELAVDALDLDHRRVSYGIENTVGKHTFHTDHLLFRGNVCP